ncbi:longevity-assurance protein-like protein [Bimuria novae-zelandiae CBS 107.79]|uniref:Longevity-assurance protein-like protein n=1 Tax=Bimuria novae-zelandiae CBS 107.79 TaxID=1447943 RepID=A0A6A5USW5_9PLEO|nr:longevity-assurance protein-like protein [Bimuria novae-zelandiae CBS 107.79]
MDGANDAHKPYKRAKPRTENDGLFTYLCMQLCEHQIGISVNLLSLLFLTHVFFPRARQHTRPFFHLSYYNPDTEKYGCGTDDLSYVALWLVIFVGLRVAIMDYVLAPLARRGGITTKKGLVRFQEQAWLVCYCVCSWSLGVYITWHSEYFFNLHGMWEGWPFREITGMSKFYYLVQWAFWIAQILVVNIEEKRKDYAEMFTHHIFTIALLFLSYGFYHTRVGIVILCTMDLVDIVLPTAKLLKYLGYAKTCDIFFGLFVVVWLVTRQIFFPIVIYSVYKHAPIDIQSGCYFNDGTMVPASDSAKYDALGGNIAWLNLVKAYTDREGPVCWNPTIRYSFLGLLLSLQAIIFLWFCMIIKVVINVVRGNSADDVRSDDEGDDEEVDEKIDGVKTGYDAQNVSAAPLEEEVGVEALNFAARKSNINSAANVRRSKTQRTTRASGISIPGHGDHKELLGRIGCDKPS